MPATKTDSGTVIQSSRSLFTPRVVLAIACVLLFVQQLPFFQSRWIEDENSYSDSAWAFAREGRIRMSMYPPNDIGSEVDTRMPAMPIALGITFKTLGLGIWQARFIPLMCALGAILMTFLLGSFLVNEWAGAIAALLLATDSMLFLAGRTARPETIIATLNTLAALLFIRAIRRNSWKLALVAGLAAGLAMNFHVNGAIAALSMALWAIYEYGITIWKKPVAWVFAITCGLCLAPYILWITQDQVHRDSYRAYQATGTVVPMGKLHGEIVRYSDFIGLSNTKVKTPLPIPVRAPIAILIIAGLYFLWSRNRRVFWYFFLLVIAHMGWWYYMSNKSVRYTAVAAPVFSLIVAAGALAYATTPRRRQIAVAACLLYAVIGVAGNVFIVNSFRRADYTSVASQLQKIVPEHTVVYGAATFWLALSDRQYYAYDRALFDYTIANLKPQYLILYDRVMMNGSGAGVDDFEDVRTKGTAYVKSHGEKVGEVSSNFYGNLEVFKVTDRP